MTSFSNRRLSTLISYCDVVNGAESDKNAGRPFEDLNVGFSTALTNSLAFEYNFEIENEAIKNLVDWERLREQRKSRLQFFREMVDSKKSNELPTQSNPATHAPEPTGETQTNREPRTYEPMINSTEPSFPSEVIDQNKIAQFREYTGASESRAMHYLRAYDWSVDSAVKQFFENS